MFKVVERRKGEKLKIIKLRKNYLKRLKGYSK
jgi:hypothetical protein